jgi:ubiquinone/menaquinone biosynthesis C-methylase UbiE
VPEATIAGIDISQYAYDNALESVKPFLRVGDAKSLPFEDDSFDLVLGLSTVHNLPFDECKAALGEIARVSSKHAFITVDAWRTDAERERLERWVVTARTYMHVDDWVIMFGESGYTGDYYWFIP